MQCWAHLLRAISLAILLQASRSSGQKIILTNDDGWAVAQIRAQRDSLVSAGFNVRRILAETRGSAEPPNLQVVLSAPADNRSGTGSSSATPQPLTQPCEFNTCPTGSPAEGFNASDSEFVIARERPFLC